MVHVYVRHASVRAAPDAPPLVLLIVVFRCVMGRPYDVCLVWANARFAQEPRICGHRQRLEKRCVTGAGGRSRGRLRTVRGTVLLFSLRSTLR